MDEPIGKTSLGKGLHVAHLNVRSLMGRNSFDVTKYQIKSSGIDVFTLSETWLTEAIPDQAVAIEGYNLIRLDRKWSDPERPSKTKKGGGVACYVGKGLNFSDSALANLNVSCKDVEMLWLKLSLKNVRPIVVVSIYRPPQGNHARCCELIGNALEKANLKDNTDIFLLGDFNVNFADKKSPSYKELSFVTGMWGLHQQITTPTRYYVREGVPTSSTIDLIFTNSDFVAYSGTMDLNLSDHLAVLVTRKKLYAKREKIEFRGRSYRNYNRADFQNRLANEDWAPFFESESPNEQWDIMFNIIVNTIDQMCPIRSHRVEEIKGVADQRGTRGY